MTNSSTNSSKVLYVCPKCKEKALHVQGQSGRDDYGEIEGEQEWCEKCGHTDEWAGRC